jgi:hypothetical protein
MAFYRGNPAEVNLQAAADGHYRRRLALKLRQQPARDGRGKERVVVVPKSKVSPGEEKAG